MIRLTIENSERGRKLGLCNGGEIRTKYLELVWELNNVQA